MKFYFLGGFDKSGVSSLVTSDATLGDLAKTVAELLPENQKLHHVRPEWLADNSFDITRECEVVLRFLDEGAGYRNSVGYFVYPTASPPETIAHIRECIFLFPNCSKSGSGGALNCGDSVKLASEVERNEKTLAANPTSTVFRPGTSIGWILYPNGWTGAGVNEYVVPYTSLSDLNPEKARELKYHTVCLQVPGTERLLLSFEDLNRESSGCDHDFNDAVFIVDTDLSSVGDAFVDTRGFTPNDTNPEAPTDYVIGYKKVFVDVEGETLEAVATLLIPRGVGNIVRKVPTNRFKCEEAYVKSIVVVPPRSRYVRSTRHIGLKVDSGRSWYNRDFIYTVGQMVRAEGFGVDPGAGIYFYYSRQEAAKYDFQPTTF